MLFIPRERLVPMVRAAVESGLQFTAHSVGDGAVHALLDAYEEVNQTDAGRADPAVHHPLELHEPRGDRAGRAAGGRGRHPAGLALPRHADARRPVRRRPAALLPAAAEPVRGRGDRRRRLGPHAEDRLAPVDQPVQPVPRDVGRDHAARQGLRGPAPPRGGADPRAGDPLLHHQQRPPAVPGGPDRLARSRASRRTSSSSTGTS